ncbi:CBS domain-containing protein [Salinirubrum litoreum]|uniref:CBS domain-containing protein n=1 Tax=Salinirubrum litoreum TaxID=1126234 RepID=A0ABD5R9Z4_9EURY|nr:CBS domain-containing protein [Salinirubrum litoreum]
MFGDQERVTVRELMTDDIERVSAGASVGEVHEWLTENGYTAAPVARDDPPHLYVTRADLDEALPGATDDPVYKHAERVGLEDLVAPDAEFGELLAELEERPVYFVGWHGEVVGVVSRSDLNKPAAHAFLYTRVGELEMRLRDLVDAEADWEGTLATEPARDHDGCETEYDAVLQSYESYEDADIQLRPIDYTTFYQLQKCLRASPEAVEELPFADTDEADDAVDAIRNLRNHVAHYGNVVHNVDETYLNSGRNVHELSELYATMTETLEALRDWSDRETGERPVGQASD